MRTKINANRYEIMPASINWLITFFASTQDQSSVICGAFRQFFRTGSRRQCK